MYWLFFLCIFPVYTAYLSAYLVFGTFVYILKLEHALLKPVFSMPSI